MIDLRSDTVTRPTPTMRRAMAEAEVGDDVFGDDPTVHALERETAEILGKSAAVFVASGTMANAAALIASVDSGDEVFLHARSHIMTHEQGGVAVLTRALPRPFNTPDGVPSDETLDQWIHGADDIHRARPRLICLENTLFGMAIPLREQRRVAAFAGEHQLRVHLDGARLWNAATALAASPAEVAAPADTVSVCFSKGLGAPIGSIVAGDAETVARARRARKLLGGGMRQVGVIAAGALYALRHHRERVREDHERAHTLADALNAMDGLDASANTNIIRVHTAPGMAGPLRDALAARGVGCVAMGSNLLRLVVHLDITDDDITSSISAMEKALTERA